MTADWSSWVEFAKQRQAGGASSATIMVELSARGASAGEAEAVVRSIGSGFTLSETDRQALVAEISTARLLTAGGIAAIVGGIGLLFLLGARTFGGGGNGPVAAGALIVVGLSLVGKNVGIAFRRPPTR